MGYSKQDCINDTVSHIEKVRERIYEVMEELDTRAWIHDASKIHEPELSIFTEFTPKLANTTYGSDEYKEHLKGMQVGLKHHYENNSHHPEHYENGINDMDLLDVVEMLCDWKAASERHNDGDIKKSLEINKERFHMDEQLYKILSKTIDNLGWEE